MSHYSIIDTQIVSVEHLLRALAQMGFPEVETHESPQTLYGWRGDARPQRAEVIIRKEYLGPASNDIGFKRNAAGRFEAVVSEYDRQSGYGSAWLQRLTQLYAYHVAKEMVERMDFTVVAQEVAADQTIHITLRRMA